MATLTTEVDNSAYTLILDSGTDGLIQAVGTVDLLIVFDTSLPAVDHAHYHVLSTKDYQGMTVIGGVPAGNAYARALGDSTTERTARVSVS